LLGFGLKNKDDWWDAEKKLSNLKKAEMGKATAQHKQAVQLFLYDPAKTS
jgi:hypothetical protein